MSGNAPARAFYEAYGTAMLYPVAPWDDLADDYRAALETGVQAAIDAALPDEMESRLEQIADWFDADDKVKMWLYEQRPDVFPGTWKERGHEMQDDLRHWAKLLRDTRQRAGIGDGQ